MGFYHLIILIAVLVGRAGSNSPNISKDQPAAMVNGTERSIPFTYDNRTISFDVLVNGRYEGEFIFDSGLTTYYNLFSDKFHREVFALPEALNQHRISGIGVDHHVNVSKKTVDFDMGGYSFDGYYSVISQSYSDRRRYDGLLNVHVFRDSIVEFDFNRRRVIFHRQFSGDGYQQVKIIQRGFVRMVDIRAMLDNGFEISGRFLLDTGYWGLLALYCSSREVDSLKKIYSVNRILGVSNFSKEIEFNRMECGRAAVMKSILINPTIVIGNVSLPQEAKGSLQGLVGVEFFKMFNPVVDFKRNIMYLKVQPTVKSRNMHELGMHLFLTNRGWIVKHVVQNSEAYSKGIRPNDEVMLINSRVVNHLSESDLENLLDSLHSTKTPVELTLLREGKRMNVILEGNPSYLRYFSTHSSS